MAGRKFHVTQAGQRWQIEVDGVMISEHDTQTGAVSLARQRAQAEVPSEVLVHGADGQIYDTASYSGDRFGHSHSQQPGPNEARRCQG
ncbi:hypothetical protein SAMN04489812_0425 [Microlunatus soli]|uniref:DUF2188 domain-containing protein n=2 Tax=Microlunatus soli TaxID=630515 RepID=A0A1H1N8N3_9ACTN|nr:hypothetical protein SAMN04489812_0425 [Microlunatus soli]